MEEEKTNVSFCPINKPKREDAVECALGLLRKALFRKVPETFEDITKNAYSAEEIEKVISRAFPLREEYLTKIAKVALHLSLFTRTGRVSYTFQENIFNKSLVDEQDFLEWLVTKATDEEMFPELYQSQGYLEELDRQSFEKQMKFEHDALLEGLRTVTAKCCDEKVCTTKEIDDSYTEELFKSGTVFNTSAKNICITRKVEKWIPPSTDITFPDETPIGSENFDISGQVMCLDINNLIHNFAILEKGRLLQLPWGREHMKKETQDELMERFRVEIQMRKWYLDQL